MDSPTFTLNNVPIFSTGTWNQDVYNEADLDHMVAAYHLVGFKPPLKIGHDESQPMAKSDSMPSIGWVTNLRRMGQKLYADIVGLPQKVYDAIRRKNYDRVSAEVYWDYADGGRKLPRVLKALALLGAEIPAVTDLASLEALYDASGKPFKRYDLADGLSSQEDRAPPQDVDVLELPVEIDATKTYIIQKRGDKWVLVAKSDGKVLGTHDSEADAKKQEVAIEISKHGYTNPNHMPAGTPEGGQFAPAGGGGGGSGKIESQNTSWGYHGTMQSSGKSSAQAADAFHKTAGRVMALGKMSADAAREFLDSRWGRHLADQHLEGKTNDAVILTHVKAWKSGGGKSFMDTGTDVHTFTLPVEAVKRVCPGCADKMAFLNLKELKLTFDPATKTYAGFSRGMCDHFGDAAGFRTRCMEDNGKLSEAVDDLGAFCNSLKEYCFGSVSAESERTSAKTHSDAARGTKTMADMQVQEKDGQWCVTAGGKDMKCFPTKDEADAYLSTEGGEDDVSMMKEQDARIKELTDQLAAVTAGKTEAETKAVALTEQVATLSAKVPQLEKYVSDSEAEKAALKESARVAGNAQWIKDQTTEGNLRILPVEAPVVAHMLDQLTQNGGPTLKAYTAEDGKELSVVEAFKSIFERRKPGTLLFEELSKGRGTETAGEPESETPKVVGMAEAKKEAVVRAKQYMKDKNEKSFKAAMDAVYAADPALKDMAAGVTDAGDARSKGGSEHMARFFKQETVRPA